MKGARPNALIGYDLPYVGLAKPDQHPPEWPFRTGDMVEVHFRGDSGSGWQARKPYRGRVVAVAPQVLVVDTGKYRISVARHAWWAGYAKIEKLEEAKQVG